MAKEWSKKWLKDVDPKKITLFPLQLANCDRLEKNNAVYIFDEVGSGKTISAGLMALHYLYNNYGARILVITTSQLADHKGEPGPFKQIWLDKLPFHKWGCGSLIRVINHDYRNIKGENDRNTWVNRKGDNWDLVIIDEAHMFLNRENKRYKELVGGEEGGKICTQKVVFLTATPIKEGLRDLLTYSSLARQMTHSQGRNTNNPAYRCFDSVIDEDMNAILAPMAISGQISPKDLICSTFDVARPFTRYFKDTVRALKLDSDSKEDLFPIRKRAKVWMCDRENRQETVLRKIDELYNENPQKNRFVIFVRWVKKNSIDPGCSAEELEAYFIEHGFSKWDEGHQEKSVEVVTGANHKPLSNYSDPDPIGLPTVLIINYQIGEQGVNLPGYNHVINYHIPASPASLEQRFGRIDRLDSAAKEINIYYPLLKSDCDNSTRNFYIAVSTYLKQLLPVLPTRNAILTDEILEVYEKYSKEMRKQADKIRMILDQWRADKQKGTGSQEKILKYLGGTVSGDDLDQNEREVAEFIHGADKTIDTEQPESDCIELIINICKGRLKEIDNSAVPYERIEAAREFIGPNGDEIGNLIFYYADRLHKGMTQDEILKKLKTISQTGDNGCAELIRNSSSYGDYQKQIKRKLNKRCGKNLPRI